MIIAKRKNIVEEALKRADHVLAGTFRGRKVERNDPCPCGSGQKYKKCCMRKLNR